MSERSDRIIMADNEPRCEPIGYCTMRSKCARVQAPIVRGTKSFPVQDYTQGITGQVYGGTAICPGYMAIAARHTEHTRPPIKPSVKGLS
jgi:hypothetical protein